MRQTIQRRNKNHTSIEVDTTCTWDPIL